MMFGSSIIQARKIIDALVDYLPTLFSALAVLFVGFYAIAFLSKLVDKAMTQREFDISLKSFIKSLINIALKIILVISVAGMLGIHTTSFVAVLGAAGLAVGLALQGSLANFAGGVLILFFKPYKVGDTIEVDGVIGEVKEIQIFNTVLLKPDHRTAFLPNGAVSNNKIINHSKEGSLRTEMQFFFPVERDFSHVKSIIEEAIQSNPEVVKSKAIEIFIVEVSSGYYKVVSSFFSTPENIDNARSVILERCMMQFIEARIHTWQSPNRPA